MGGAGIFIGIRKFLGRFAWRRGSLHHKCTMLSFHSRRSQRADFPRHRRRIGSSSLSRFQVMACGSSSQILRGGYGLVRRSTTKSAILFRLSRQEQPSDSAIDRLVWTGPSYFAGPLRFSKLGVSQCHKTLACYHHAYEPPAYDLRKLEIKIEIPNQRLGFGGWS